MQQERILGQILLGTITRKLRGFFTPNKPTKKQTLTDILKKSRKKFDWLDAITRWEGPVLATLIIGGFVNLTIQVYMAERYDDITRKLHLWNHFYKLYLENLEYCDYLQERNKIWENRLKEISQQVFAVERAEENAQKQVNTQIEIIQKQCPLAIDLMDFKVIFQNYDHFQNYSSSHDVNQTYFIHGFLKSCSFRIFSLDFQFFWGQSKKNQCVNALKNLAKSRQNQRYVQLQECYTRQKFEVHLQQVAEVHYELLISLQQQQKYLQILRFLGDQSARQHQFGVYSILPSIIQQYFYDFQLNYFAGCWFQEEKLDEISKEYDDVENVDVQSLMDYDE
eukprot:TRINITY_DN84947_c0_g1_i1.p1 TRINITY_DN84947_c0_g1~~TRINITY_DN84947_c0_g1_i1.p1  ORF type:complete len:337 (+),score=36.46 TRINITY_DN84947_c0_g1_i1:130-1140(+)